MDQLSRQVLSNGISVIPIKSSQALQGRAGKDMLQVIMGTRRIYQAPSYSVFYQVLTRMDPETFTKLLSDWLFIRAGDLPQTVALGGK
jgi:hypothetical protein